MTRPAGSWWAANASTLGLTKRGREWTGPCPSCNGTDRFAVRERDGLFNCRQCKSFKEIIEAAEKIVGVPSENRSRITDAEMIEWKMLRKRHNLDNITVGSVPEKSREASVSAEIIPIKRWIYRTDRDESVTVWREETNNGPNTPNLSLIHI